MTEETIPAQTEEDLEIERLENENSGGQDGDPLDKITDPEELRKTTKAYRSAFKKWRGVAKKAPAEIKAPVVLPPELPADVVRKSDLERVATSQAKEMVGSEIAEVWDELVKIPLSGYDPLDPKSIASNIKERFAIYRSRNPKKDAPADTSHLRTTTAPKGTGGADPEEAPKIKTPTKPDSWYPKKEA